MGGRREGYLCSKGKTRDSTNHPSFPLILYSSVIQDELDHNSLTLTISIKVSEPTPSQIYGYTYVCTYINSINLYMHAGIKDKLDIFTF